MSIREREDELFDRWQRECPGLMRDGVVDEAAYLASQPKILFVLKEGNAQGELGLDLREIIADNQRDPTWSPIARWVYGIRNRENDISWAKLCAGDSGFRGKQTRTIVAVNLNKIPGSTRADWRTVRENALQYRRYLCEQFALYAPDLTICCGGDQLADLYWEIVGDQTTTTVKWERTTRGIWFLRAPMCGCLLDYVHPEIYCPDHLIHYPLIAAVRETLDSA